jgi:RNA polymerase sigma-70 factor (ECF subfamily)
MCEHILKDPAAAEDAVMEGALRAWENIAKCESTFLGWLFRITKNAALDMKASAYVRHRAPLDEETSIPTSTFDDEILRKFRVRELLSRLDDDEREIILLQYYYRYSTAEIAEILGITGAAARKRLSRALRKLRATLDNPDREADDDR